MNNSLIMNVQGVYYISAPGVVIKDKILTREDFKDWFNTAYKDMDRYTMFNMELAKVQKIIHIIESNKKRQSITEFTNNLDQIATLFSETIFEGLGGDISLMATLNRGNKKQETYYLLNQKDLKNKLSEAGERAYYASRRNLLNARQAAHNLDQLNTALKGHLNGFASQLGRKDLQSAEDRQSLYTWASYNMRRRYDEQRYLQHPIPLNKYFWGSGQVHGYVGEAFGAHLALMHPDFLNGGLNHKLKPVIQEHGGPGDWGLFALLGSTKGNTMSQLSGDIVVVDEMGNVTFNIQSKVSKKGNYSFTTTYKKFISNIMLYKEICEKFIAGTGNDEDIDTLFRAFSTNAWMPLQSFLEKNADYIVDEEIKHIIKVK